jgi:CRP-like cAMP-binding protein
MIAGVLEELKVDKGDDICVEGEDEGLLFILFDGECIASKESDPDVTRIMTKGDWIGEHQLQNSETAEETLTVTSEFAVALVLDMSSLNMVTKAGQALKKWGENADFDLREKFDCADSFAHRRISRSANRRSVKRRSLADGGARSSRAMSLRLTEMEVKEEVEPGFDVTAMDRIGVLGEGGFGSVVLMEDKKGEKYALKGLLKNQIIADGMSSAVANERNILMLLDSDFIVRCFASFIDSKCVYFLLEPVFGGELFDVFMDLNLFGSHDHARFYTACITLGLQHMHRNRVVYRDLKLENCLLDEKGFVKLTDVGIAKIVLGKTYTICGTADYFAPETLRQAGHNRGVDWWACGVLLFIMCAGQSPFDAPEVTQIYKNIIKGFSKVKFPKEFTSDLIEVVKALCRKKPEDRVTMQKGGVDNLMAMTFFSDFDWSGLSARTLDAPLVPEPPDFSKLAAKKLTRDISLTGELQEWDGNLEWCPK